MSDFLIVRVRDRASCSPPWRSGALVVLLGICVVVCLGVSVMLLDVATVSPGVVSASTCASPLAASPSGVVPTSVSPSLAGDPSICSRLSCVCCRVISSSRISAMILPNMLLPGQYSGLVRVVACALRPVPQNFL